VSVVRVNPVVVPCGGLMLRRERHGRGGDILLRELHLMDPGGGLSSSAICAFYTVGPSLTNTIRSRGLVVTQVGRK
jgi:hypothetical protein